MGWINLGKVRHVHRYVMELMTGIDAIDLDRPARPKEAADFEIEFPE